MALRINASGVVVVPPFECAWLNGNEFTLHAGCGCVVFEAKGATDATVIFKAQPGAKRLQPLRQRSAPLGALPAYAAAAAALPGVAPGVAQVNAPAMHVAGGHHVPLHNPALHQAQNPAAHQLHQQLLPGHQSSPPATVEDNYTVILGSHRNSCLKLEKNGTTVARLQGVPGASVSVREFQAFWVDCNSGVISVGSGFIPGEKLGLKWVDPEGPIPDIRHVGLSCWDCHVSYRNIQLRPAVAFTTLLTAKSAGGIGVETVAIHAQSGAGLHTSGFGRRSLEYGDMAHGIGISGSGHPVNSSCAGGLQAGGVCAAANDVEAAAQPLQQLPPPVIIPSLFSVCDRQLQASCCGAEDVCDVLAVAELLLPTTLALYRHALEAAAACFDELGTRMRATACARASAAAAAAAADSAAALMGGLARLASAGKSNGSAFATASLMDSTGMLTGAVKGQHGTARTVSSSDISGGVGQDVSTGRGGCKGTGFGIDLSMLSAALMVDLVRQNSFMVRERVIFDIVACWACLQLACLDLDFEPDLPVEPHASCMEDGQVPCAGGSSTAGADDCVRKGPQASRCSQQSQHIDGNGSEWDAALPMEAAVTDAGGGGVCVDNRDNHTEGQNDSGHRTTSSGEAHSLSPSVDRGQEHLMPHMAATAVIGAETDTVAASSLPVILSPRTASASSPSYAPTLSIQAAAGDAAGVHLRAQYMAGQAEAAAHAARNARAGARAAHADVGDVLCWLRYPLMSVAELQGVLAHPLAGVYPWVTALVREVLHVHEQQTSPRPSPCFPTATSLGSALPTASSLNNSNGMLGSSSSNSHAPSLATAVSAHPASRRMLQPEAGSSAGGLGSSGSGNLGVAGLLGGNLAGGHVSSCGNLMYSQRYSHRRGGCGQGGMCQELLHVCDGDENGVLHFIGTQYGTQTWMNPVLSKQVTVRASSPASRTTDAKAIVGRTYMRTNFAGPRYVNGQPVTWWSLDLGPNHRLVINHYTLRHDDSRAYPRSWVLQGSIDAADVANGCSSGSSAGSSGGRGGSSGDPVTVSAAFVTGGAIGSSDGATSAAVYGNGSAADGGNSSGWVDLKRHSYDTSMRVPGQFGSWPVLGPAASVPYRSFRLLQAGPSASPEQPHCLCLSAWEVYGYLTVLSAPPPAQTAGATSMCASGSAVAAGPSGPAVAAEPSGLAAAAAGACASGSATGLASVAVRLPLTAAAAPAAAALPEGSDVHA